MRFAGTWLAMLGALGGCGLSATGTETPLSGADASGIDVVADVRGPAPDATLDGTEPMGDAGAPDALADSAPASDASDAQAGCGDASTPLNCGVCGRSCLGGACLAGVCQPVVLAHVSGSPRNVAVVGASLYWTDMGGGVEGCSLPACAPFSFCSSTDADGIVATASTVYWTDFAGNRTLSSPVNGCVAKQLDTGGGPSGMAIDATSVYWVDNSTGKVMKVALDGSGLTPLVSGQQGPRGLAVDGTYVYWVNGGDGSVWRARKDTGTGSTQLYNGVATANPDRIAVDATRLYWANEGGSVMSASLDGTNPNVLATGLGDPRGIATDGVSVYWTNMSAGSVTRCPVGGCGGSPEVLASGQSQPDGLVLDAASVYWVDHGGNIMRLAK